MRIPRRPAEGIGGCPLGYIRGAPSGEGMAAPIDPRFQPAIERGEAPILVEEPVYVRDARAGDIDLREIIDLAIRGKWIVLGTLLAVLIPTVLYTWNQPNVYEARATLLVETRNDDVVSVLPAGSPASMYKNERNLNNELLVLNQELALAEAAAEELLRFARVPETEEPLTVLQPKEEGAGPLSQQQIARRLQGSYVQARAAGNDVDAVEVVAQSTTPGEAALIANVYANQFVDLAQASSRSSVSASREFLESQVEDRGDALSGYDQRLQAFMQREQAVSLSEETNETVAQLASLEAQRDAVDVEIEQKRGTIAALQQQLGTVQDRGRQQARTGGVDPALLEATRAQLTALEARLDAIYARNPDFRGADELPPDVAALEAQAEALRGRIDELAASVVDVGGPADPTVDADREAVLTGQLTDARVRLRALQSQRRQLDSRIAGYESELASIPAQQIELAQLQRERLAAETLYGSLESKLQEARVAEESELGYARVVRPAFTPSIPVAPHRTRNVALAIFLGLAFGVILAVGRVRLDHRIFRPDDLQQKGFALLGTIPDVDALIKKDFDGKETIDVDGRDVDTHLIALLNPMATASETYRALRTSVQFSRPDAVVETVLVTSPNPGEGKSVTAANLAVVMAQSGRRVLLVDADLRRPTVHQKLGLSREPGLVQLLFSDAPPTFDDMRPVADDLYALPAGSLAPNPSELLGSKRMREVLASLNGLFDLVILDAPPVLAATDAVLLSTQADATLVVVRSGKTRDYELESAMDALNGVGAKTIGTVLNGFHISKAYGYRYKYAYRYGRDYAYGYSQKS